MGDARPRCSCSRRSLAQTCPSDQSLPERMGITLSHIGRAYKSQAFNHHSKERDVRSDGFNTSVQVGDVRCAGIGEEGRDSHRRGGTQPNEVLCNWSRFRESPLAAPPQTGC